MANGIFLIVVECLPLLFLGWLIYIWIKKDDEYLDIVLYSVYAAVLGILMNFIISIIYFYSPLFTSSIVTLMFSIALMLSCFKETRKSGIILIILGLIISVLRVFYTLNNPLDILISSLVAITSTAIVYYFKEKLIEVNQIFKAAYYILR